MHPVSPKNTFSIPCTFNVSASLQLPTPPAGSVISNSVALFTADTSVPAVIVQAPVVVTNSPGNTPLVEATLTLIDAAVTSVVAAGSATVAHSIFILPPDGSGPALTAVVL